MSGDSYLGNGWHPRRIVAECAIKGTNLSRLSLQAGYARNTLHWALYRPNIHANRIIADHLGVSLHELWPDWFGPDDQLLPLPRRRTAA